MFGGYNYDPYDHVGDAFYDGYDTFLADESFEEHYGDEIEDRVIYAMEPESEPTVQQQLTLWAAY